MGDFLPSASSSLKAELMVPLDSANRSSSIDRKAKVKKDSSIGDFSSLSLASKQQVAHFQDSDKLLNPNLNMPSFILSPSRGTAHPFTYEVDSIGSFHAQRPTMLKRGSEQHEPQVTPPAQSLVISPQNSSPYSPASLEESVL